MRLRQVGLVSLEAFAKQGLLEGASTCKLEINGHGILEKKTKVKFSTGTHHSHGLLDNVHVDVWGLTKTASHGAIGTLSLVLMIYLGVVGSTP